MSIDYESWRCPTRDTFDGKTGVSVFCPPEGCPEASGCARDNGWEPGKEFPAHPRPARGADPESCPDPPEAL